MEIERARLTKRLAKIKEEEGNISEAAEILQEVAVVSPASHRSSCQHREIGSGAGVRS